MHFQFPRNKPAPKTNQDVWGSANGHLLDLLVPKQGHIIELALDQQLEAGFSLLCHAVAPGPCVLVP